MLEHLNHPFLCNLRYSFQDIEYLYVECLPAGNEQPETNQTQLHCRRPHERR